MKYVIIVKVNIFNKNWSYQNVVKKPKYKNAVRKKSHGQSFAYYTAVFTAVWNARLKSENESIIINNSLIENIFRQIEYMLFKNRFDEKKFAL